MIPETLGTDMLARAASGAALPVDTISEADGITARGEGDPTTITNELRDAFPWGSLSFAALPFSFSLLLVGGGCLRVLLPRFQLFHGLLEGALVPLLGRCIREKLTS